MVSLFLNPEVELVENVLGKLPIDLIQFHGKEHAEFCRSFGKPYIKAIGMAGKGSLADKAAAYPDARGLLLDSHETGAAGGTGEIFNWDAIPDEFRSSIILAGGLKPENVAGAIRKVRPFAVDLSSGVEAEPGIKDAALMAQLFKEIKQVDCELIE